MTRALLITVHFHDGRYHGYGDWPPSPARLFQALVAAAAKTVLDTASRSALEWLEKLSAPVVAAPQAISGQHVSMFMPNNDLDAYGGDIRRIAKIRTATKQVKPRLFDASLPLLYAWRFDGDDVQANRIREIAGSLYQLGRGVDMAWAVGEVLDEGETDARLSDYRGVIYRPANGGKGTPLNCPDEGSLDSLVIRHQLMPQRFRHVRTGGTVRIEFANAPRPRFRTAVYNSPANRLLFDLRRTTAPGSPLGSWPLNRAAALVLRLRDSAVAKLARYERAECFSVGSVNKVLVGRDATEADKALRLRIVPLPSIGHAMVDRSIRRVLVEVPPDCPLRTDDIKWAFAGLEIEPPKVDEHGEIVSSPVELVPAGDHSMLERYCANHETPSRLWRSVTPLALPVARRRVDSATRHKEMKKGSERQFENQRILHEVKRALRHAGLRYRITGARVQRESFQAKGDRAEAFASETRFSRNQLWHVEIEFAEAIDGLVVLGSGRYLGLGLMEPVHRIEGVYSFAITDGLTDQVEVVELARSLRRAVMARVQRFLDKQKKLPTFFTGHKADGALVRGGGHTHLAFVPDLERGRLMVVAPHLIEHRKPSNDERSNLKILAQALVGFDELRAGCSGKLRLMSMAVDVGADPIFAASRSWRTLTPYLATRHAKRDPMQFLIADVTTELLRRGLPKPAAVVPGQVKSGQAGRVEAELTVEFETAVNGPVLIGSNLHFGGGLLQSGSVLGELPN